jgi:hypothetical protein
MRNSYFLLAMLCMCAISLNAQTHCETFTACNKSYTITTEKQTGSKIVLKYVDGLDDSVHRTFSIVTNDIEQFARSFRQFFLVFAGADTSACTAEEKRNFLLSYGRQVFLNIVAANTIDSVKPVAGIMKIRDSVLVHAKLRFYRGGKIDEIKTPFAKYKVLRVTGEINDGFVENIKAYIQVKDQTLYFSIPYAVGISSVANFKQYKSREMYDMDSPIRFSRVSGKTRNALRTYYGKDEKALIKIDSIFYIRLSDLIDYDYRFGVNRRDYSPEDRTIDIEGGRSEVLHKQETKRLFEAHIFTDFIGLKEAEPNGLIQVGVSKRINTNSNQQLSKPWIHWLFKSYGVFQYVRPSITFSKVEQHNKFLSLNDMDSVRAAPGQIDTSKIRRAATRFTTPIQLYQYQSFSGGVDFNVGNLSNHNLKYSLFFDVGARLGLTPVRDSLTRISGDTITRTGFADDYLFRSIQLSACATLNFLPEERFNLSLSQRPVYMIAMDQRTQLLHKDRKEPNKLNVRKAALLSISELLMTIQVNDTGNGKLFGRIRFIADLSNGNDNFAQVQVGYSTYILGNK